MMMQDSMDEGDFSQPFLGRLVVFYYTVTNSYALHANFTLGGRAYTFSMSRWSGRGLSKFLPLFFEYKDRDNDTYGVVDVSDNGYEFRMNTAQKLQVILQAARDVVRTIDMIFEVHGRGIVDYCIWYRETHESVETYAKYVTVVACHCVVHSKLLAPQITWQLVTFPDGEDT
jgi:hypothetical protein